MSLAHKSLHNNTSVSLTKFWNKMMIGNFAWSYGLLLLIFTTIFKARAFNGEGQYIGNLVFSILIVTGGWCFTFCFIIRMFHHAENPHEQQLYKISWILSLCAPVVGLITTHIWKKKENTFYNNHNKNSKNFKQRKFKMPSVYATLFFILLFVILILWVVYIVTGGITKPVVPGEDTGIYPTPGALDIFYLPLLGFENSVQIIIFLLVIGVLLSFVIASKSLEAGVGRLIKKMHGREIILIPILMILFSFGGSIFGMCEETVPFYMIIIPFMLAAGFDTVTGLMLVLFGAGMGVAGSIINPFVVTVAIDSSAPITVNISDGIIWRIIVTFVLEFGAIAFVMHYAHKVKSNPQKSLVYEQRKANLEHFKLTDAIIPEFTLKRKVTLIIFSLCFLIMIMGIVNWQKITGWDGFEQFNNWISTVFPFISSIGSIGSWYLAEIAFIFLVATFIIGVMFWHNEEHFVESVLNGAKDFLGVCVVISLATGISLALSNSGANVSIATWLGNQIISMHAIGVMLLIFVCFTLISLLIPSTSGFAKTIFPIIAPAMNQAGYTVSSGIFAFATSNGLINMFSPTAGIFLIGASVSKVPLNIYYKCTWKLLIFTIVAILMLLILGTFVPTVFF